MAWLEKIVLSGRPVGEWVVAQKLYAFRRQEDLFM